MGFPHPAWELPPRARRILTHVTRLTSVVGTTSACAENTRGCSPGRLCARNYLRVRGEYGNPSWDCSGIWELPPRARRIPPSTPGAARLRGTTSACAENTLRNDYMNLEQRNYLRVRGEYPHNATTPIRWVELPPRARRIRAERFVLVWVRGTTSACAENTSCSAPMCHPKGNYLRVRGEYPK